MKENFPSKKIHLVSSVATPRKGKRPRLEKHHYQGHAVVFWTNTLEERSRGWLTPTFHATFRELMLHAAAREYLFYPAYCLMPDRLHLIWMGLRRESDQLNAMKFLHTHLEPALGGGREWQHPPHDHVLREEERRRNAFASFCFYILADPGRAGLATDVAADVRSRKNPLPHVSGYPRNPPPHFGGCKVANENGLTAERSFTAILILTRLQTATGNCSGSYTSRSGKPNHRHRRRQEADRTAIQTRNPPPYVGGYTW